MVLSRIFHAWEVALSRRDTNRKVREFEWGLEFLPGAPAAGDPKAALLEYARRAVEESERYHAYAPVRDYRLDGQRLTYPSPLVSRYERNNTVHGRFFPVDSRGRAVLVLPQWNADAEGHLSLCRLLNAFGLSALRLSQPYHDLRMPEELERADYALSPNLGRTLEATRQAVMDCRAAIDWLERQGYSRFAILGTSLGSCTALITNAHDSRIRVAVQNHVSPWFADVVWRGISTRHVLEGLRGHISLEDLRESGCRSAPWPTSRNYGGPGSAPCSYMRCTITRSFPSCPRSSWGNTAGWGSITPPSGCAAGTTPRASSPST